MPKPSTHNLPHNHQHSQTRRPPFATLTTHRQTPCPPTRAPQSHDNNGHRWQQRVQVSPPLLSFLSHRCHVADSDVATERRTTTENRRLSSLTTTARNYDLTPNNDPTPNNDITPNNDRTRQNEVHRTRRSPNAHNLQTTQRPRTTPSTHKGHPTPTSNTQHPQMTPKRQHPGARTTPLPTTHGQPSCTDDNAPPMHDNDRPPRMTSVAAAPVQSQLKPGAEPSLAEAQPELPSDGSHISAISGSG